MSVLYNPLIMDGKLAVAFLQGSDRKDHMDKFGAKAT
jgi:hypothetical protein